MNHYTYRSILLKHKIPAYLKEAVIIIVSSMLMLLALLFLVWLWDSNASDVRYINGTVTSRHIESTLGKESMVVCVEDNSGNSELVQIGGKDAVQLGHNYKMEVTGKGSKPLKWYPKAKRIKKLY